MPTTKTKVLERIRRSLFVHKILLRTLELTHASSESLSFERAMLEKRRGQARLLLGKGVQA